MNYHEAYGREKAAHDAWDIAWRMENRGASARDIVEALHRNANEQCEQFLKVSRDEALTNTQEVAR